MLRRRGYHHRIWGLSGDPNRLNRTLVYAIWDGEYVKIGRTDVHPMWRLRMLATGSSRPLQLVGYTSTISERVAHRLLHRYRVHGEWFRISESVLGLLSNWDYLDTRLYHFLQKSIAKEIG